MGATAMSGFEDILDTDLIGATYKVAQFSTGQSQGEPPRRLQ